MTWRERIVAARERGGFTQEDKRDVLLFDRCLLGECAIAAFGAKWRDLPIASTLLLLGLNDVHGALFGIRPDGSYHRPICNIEEDKIAQAEADLDFIEDRVLQLKREAQP